jgi:hypothetical protein
MTERVYPMRVVLIAACLVAGVCLGGCTGSSTGPGEVPLGQSFELRPGTSATLQGGLTVAFETVRSDSRCPQDVTCVWAGDAIVAVLLSRSGDDQAARELHTAPNGSEASYLTYSIKLVTLTPHPRSDRPIQLNDYVATLTVNAR